jgi:hypothetical protein
MTLAAITAKLCMCLSVGDWCTGLANTLRAKISLVKTNIYRMKLTGSANQQRHRSAIAGHPARPSGRSLHLELAVPFHTCCLKANDVNRPLNML